MIPSAKAFRRGLVVAFGVLVQPLADSTLPPVPCAVDRPTPTLASSAALATAPPAAVVLQPVLAPSRPLCGAAVLDDSEPLAVATTPVVLAGLNRLNRMLVPDGGLVQAALELTAQLPTFNVPLPAAVVGVVVLHLLAVGLMTKRLPPLPPTPRLDDADCAEADSDDSQSSAHLTAVVEPRVDASSCATDTASLISTVGCDLVFPVDTGAGFGFRLAKPAARAEPAPLGTCRRRLDRLWRRLAAAADAAASAAASTSASFSAAAAALGALSEVPLAAGPAPRFVPPAHAIWTHYLPGARRKARPTRRETRPRWTSVHSQRRARSTAASPPASAGVRPGHGDDGVETLCRRLLMVLSRLARQSKAPLGESHQGGL
ncbi:hypothetical protein HK105_207372 [Polyrhizophydium stewartii]|uniref:Uncharacterized protein n=1 Tax=Polyrhizophydium stewartii TaxID=2732419 RepID=A0ABR4N0T8_9FUNG